MKEVISEYSVKERNKLLRKFWFNVVGFIFLVLIQIHYLTKIDSEERSVGGYAVRVAIPLFLEILLVIREKKLRGFLKRNY